MISRMLVLILGMFVLNMSTAMAETIELTEKNSVLFRGVVDEESVAKVQVELIEKSKAGKDLYLVLDTPGGSVIDGNMLIETIRGLPVKVSTVTIFAASMGFHIAQSLETRYITSNGTLMSHRAFMGMKGEVPGEFLTRLNYYIRTLTRMDFTAAKRMGISLKQYQELIRDEYWVEGAEAVVDKAADKVVAVRCGAGLDGTTKLEIPTFFGVITLTMSKCPLVTGPLSLDFSRIADENLPAVNDYIQTLFRNRMFFVEKYIKTNAYQQIQ
jgi:ATP-dependent Clp protease protease subunit